MDSPMRKKGDGTEGLVFDWKSPSQRGGGLTLWFLLTVAGMGGFFYLFKVIYPQSQRFTPVPQQVFVLNPAEPAHQALMHRVRDRDYLVLPGSDDTAREVQLDEHAPVFHPSFEKHVFQLQDLPRTRINVLQARLLDPYSPVLPPPDLGGLRPAEPTPSPPAPSAVLTIGFSGDLSQRQLMKQPDFSALSLSDPGAWRFQLGVDHDGRVIYALPISTGEEQIATKTLLAMISGLRFQPAQGSEDLGKDITWSTVTLHWKTAP
jgi:hypothetical protein